VLYELTARPYSTALGTPVPEPCAPELIHRADSAQDLTITRIVKKP
jgi:hypothetical protein